MFCKKKGNALLLALDHDDVKSMHKMIRSANLPESQHFYELLKTIEDKFPEVK
jgi:hypothetical protein